MTDSSTSLFLVYDGSGTPVLSEQQTSAHPGQPFSPVTGADTIYLASGFPSLHPESSLPLSPTLQLSHDCSTCSPEMLTAIARAELSRCNSTRFPSSIHRADPSALVIGASSEELQDFLDTYGGVLQLTPLLCKGSSPDFDTLVEPVLSSENGDPTLRYLTPLPLDRQKCTLCGRCGPACPEQCISSDLFLDLDQCSRCGICTDLCPEEAIDLHAMEARTARAAALVLLPGAELKIPPSMPGIYPADRMDRLFSTVFDVAVDEVISCSHSLCHYCARLESSCRRCVEACPQGAVQTGLEGIVVDQLKCSECGCCVGTCPTGAMQYLRLTDQQFCDFFTTIHPAGMQVVMGGEDELRDFHWRTDTRYQDTLFFEFPQVHALTAMHLLLLLARGASRVIILAANNKKAELHQARIAQEIITALYDQNDRIAVTTVSDLAQELRPALEPLVATPLQPAAISGNRRELLATCFHHLFSQNEEPVELTGELFSDFGSLQCDPEKCTLCLACLNECAIGALAGDPQNWTLTLQPLLCVQCGTCASVCPEQALQLLPGLRLNDQAFTRMDLARAEPMQCRQCGKVFGTRQSFERVMEIMRHRETAETLVLYEYCDTCRVRKLYEDGR